MVSLAENIRSSESQLNIGPIGDSGLLKAAAHIYKTYCRLHQKLNKTPIGVAIHRQTHRGQLLFTKRPIILPWEKFIPLEQLDGQIN